MVKKDAKMNSMIQIFAIVSKKKKKAAKFGFFHTKMGLILGLLTDNNVYPGSNQ
jgi:hypothetical protein